MARVGGRDRGTADGVELPSSVVPRGGGSRPAARSVRRSALHRCRATLDPYGKFSQNYRSLFLRRLRIPALCLKAQASAASPGRLPSCCADVPAVDRIQEKVDSVGTRRLDTLVDASPVRLVPPRDVPAVERQDPVERPPVVARPAVAAGTDQRDDGGVEAARLAVREVQLSLLRRPADRTRPRGVSEHKDRSAVLVLEVPPARADRGDVPVLAQISAIRCGAHPNGRSRSSRGE